MKNRYRVFVLVIGFSLAIALTITTIEHAGAGLYDKLQRLAGEVVNIDREALTLELRTPQGSTELLKISKGLLELTGIKEGDEIEVMMTEVEGKKVIKSVRKGK